MSSRVALGASVVGIGVLLVVACGGKVDSTSGGTSTTTIGTGTGRGPGGGISGGRPGRPAQTPLTAEAVAADIAETYCKTFSSCCVGDMQPPIDVSRCRDVISQEAMTVLATHDSLFMPDAVYLCVEGIRERVAVCGTVDIAWAVIEGHPALFAPGSIQTACADVVGRTDGTMRTPCSSTKPCADGYTCAVDECATNPGSGAMCAGQPCLDGFVCPAGTCVAGPNLDVGGTCTTADDCQLGLVCAASACAPAREHPELYKRRSSAYRIGADTCKAFSYL